MSATAVLQEPTSTASVVDSGGDRGGNGRTRFGSDSGGSAEFSMTTLSWLAAGCGVTALVLYAFQQSLQLPSGYGVEDLFGWSTPATIIAAVLNWCPPQSDRWRAAVVYVLGDIAFFYPFYGALILVAARGMHGALKSGTAGMGKVAQRALMPLSWLLVIALWIVDGVENLAGTQRIGVAVWAYLACVGIAIVLFVTFWRTVLAPPSRQKKDLCVNASALLIAVVLFAFIVIAQDPTAGCDALRAQTESAYGLAWAHRAKPGVILLALSPLMIAAGVWWFGVDLNLTDPHEKQLAEWRAAWRAGVAGVMGRTRYVLLLLALFAAFTLVLDQCRDVLLALAAPRPEDTAHPVAALAWSTTVLILGALSIGMLSYSCWLWTRLVGMARRPGLALPGNHNVADQVGEFARGWARAVAMMPLVMFCLLIAHTAGDAVTASRIVYGATGSDELRSTLVYLAIFGALAIGSGYAFLEIRRRLSLALPRDYYNREDDAYALLRTGTITRREEDRRAARGIGDGVFEPPPDDIGSANCVSKLRSKTGPFLRWLKPWIEQVIPVTWPLVLPVVALLLMLAVRACMAWFPDVTSQAPATLALLCLSLVWWMGVMGALSLAEQRQTIPWVLAIIAMAGLLGAMGFVDNHVMAMTTLATSPTVMLESLRASGLAITALLAVLSIVLWYALAYRPARSKVDATTRPWAPNQRLARFLVAGTIVVGVAVGLYLVDRQTQGLLASAAQVPVPKTLRKAMTAWAAKLPATPSEDNRVYLVASEGGGVRSAYWTAQVLAHLHDSDPSFDQRTAVLSGVSGGAVGEAVYIACLRERQSTPKVSECVRTRFQRLDALSPLIGAFLFEDAFARLLPVHKTGSDFSLCAQPGCGFLSRALGFEREWIRQFPHLAEPLGSIRDDEPQLMLNSTWVESGNRATLSTMALPPRDTPASEDVLQRLDAQPSLITGAHAAARFPFINPLAALESERHPGQPVKIIGHLADGGYHDNSGAEALSDAWRALRDLPLKGWIPQLVLIRNGQLKPGCEKHAGEEPAAEFECLGKLPKPHGTAARATAAVPHCAASAPPAAPCLPEASKAAARLAAPLEKAQLRLFVDMLGPPVTLLNVSGIGARARQASAAMAADLATRGLRAADGSAEHYPCLLDQTNEATLVPLGWYLSPAARKALDALADIKASTKPCAVPPPA